MMKASCIFQNKSNVFKGATKEIFHLCVYVFLCSSSSPQCDVCGMEPIQGVRWHCQDCPQDSAVDFCANCADWSDPFCLSPPPPHYTAR